MIAPQDIAAARLALGLQLAASREAAGLVQKQLAGLLNYGRSSVANVETGRQNVPRQFWLRCDEVVNTGTALTDGYDALEALTRLRRIDVASQASQARQQHFNQVKAVHGGQIGVAGAIRQGATTTLTRSRQSMGRVADGEPECREQILVRSASVGDERARELYIRGFGLLFANDRRDTETAQALLDRAVCRDPRFARAIAARGYARWRQYFAGWARNSDAALIGALRDVDAALEVDPESVFAHMTFIRACWDMGWHERALEAGRSIYVKNPESIDATIAFARSLLNAGLAQCSLPLIRTVLAEDPTNPSALKLTIWSLLMLGRHRQVLDVARDYLSQHPSDANTRWAVALATQNVDGAGAAAFEIAREALAADPGDVTLWVLLGYLHRLNDDEESARKTWSTGLVRVQAETLDVANHRVRAWIANLQAAVGDRHAAFQAVAELAEADPANGYLRYRLSHVLAELEEGPKALQMLESSIDCGFLSAQLLRQEQVLAWSRMRASPAFAAVVRKLDFNVERCRFAHAMNLPTDSGSSSSEYGDEQ